MYSCPLIKHLRDEISGAFLEFMLMIASGGPEQYKLMTGSAIEAAFTPKSSFFNPFKKFTNQTGDFRKAMVTVIDCNQSTPTFYAKRLYESMKGWGTTDSTLVRIVVSRCEIDLGNIKKEYENLYKKSLVQDVRGDTSGDYEKSLIALIESE